MPPPVDPNDPYGYGGYGDNSDPYAGNGGGDFYEANDYYPQQQQSSGLGGDLVSGVIGASLGVGGTLLTEWLLGRGNGTSLAPGSLPSTTISPTTAQQLGYTVAGYGSDQLVAQSQILSSIPSNQLSAAVSAQIPPGFTFYGAYYVSVPSAPGSQAVIVQGYYTGGAKTTLNASPWVLNLPNLGSVQPGGHITGWAVS